MASACTTRTIGIFAHVDAGKTTTSEAILYHTGRIHRPGRVDQGDTQLDWMEQERTRGITITSAATTCQWRGHWINLIDTPGHVDFSAEVVRSIRVIDGAVVVLCGVGGVEPQSETVWLHAQREGLPRLVFINKLDRSGADFNRVLAALKRELAPQAVALQMPIGRQDGLTGVVDLVRQRALVWGKNGFDPQVGAVPRSMAAAVEAARETLIDAVCETDETLLGLRLEGGEPDEDALIGGLRRAVIGGQLVPVCCGAALQGIGVQPLLDAVVDYLPAPQDRLCAGELAGAAGQDTEGPLRAVAFKLVKDAYIGHLTWVRVFAGQLRPGDRVLNPRTDAVERVGRIYRMHAEKREPVVCSQCGDVVGLVGMKSARTGDTLCDPRQPAQLSGFEFPEPVITVALRAPVPEAADSLQQAVLQLCDEDPTLKARFDPETGEQTLAGMGELHLEIAVDRLRSEFGLTPAVSLPQIAYRETVRRAATAVATYRRQSGGHGHYAQVRLAVEPLAQGRGALFENAAPPWRRPEGLTGALRPFIPDEYIRDVEMGVRQVLEQGVIAGYPLTDLRVKLMGGRYHEVDSARMDYRIAASMAMRRVVLQGQPGLLEPVMAVDLGVREEHLGPVTADLGRRRGQVLALEAREQLRQLRGEAPLAEVRGYATALRNLTQGRASFVLSLKHYGLVPDGLAAQVMAQRRAAGKVPTR